MQRGFFSHTVCPFFFVFIVRFSRSNILVALGDMSFRFPNLIEPWGPYMYSCLNDESVRKHALMVLTHLILNDMQKAKRPVADIAKCLVSPLIVHLTDLARSTLILTSPTWPRCSSMN